MRKRLVQLSVYQARVSRDNPRLNAFCRVAPSVRFRDLAIFFAGVFFRASDLSSRTCTDVQARFFFDAFFMKNLLSGYKGPMLVAENQSKEKPRTDAARLGGVVYQKTQCAMNW